MKAYNELSNAGKVRRLHQLALAALARYDLNSPEIAYHGFDTNLLYRVTAASGEKFMLRLAVPGWRTWEDLQSEALWLDALRRDTTIPAPIILPARSGESVLPLNLPGIPNVWNVSLMSWVPGKLLGHYLTQPNLEKMGALFAELHAHGAAWNPPPGFTTRRFEHWLSRGEENRIASGGMPADGTAPAGGLAGLPPRTCNLLEQMQRQVESAYAAIDRSDLRVIHFDLWHDNVKIHHGVLQPIDFEDTLWGFRAHDIGMAMLDLLEDTDEARYAVLLAAFRRGYTAHLAWPDDPIEPFQIGRLLWKINWVARRQAQWLGSMVDSHAPVFEHYEQTGQVIRPPAG